MLTTASRDLKAKLSEVRHYFMDISEKEKNEEGTTRRKPSQKMSTSLNVFGHEDRSVAELLQTLRSFVGSFQDFQDYNNKDGAKKLAKFVQQIAVC